MYRRQRKENLRKFAGQTERIIFAEHYGSEGFAKGNTNYFDKCNSLKANVYQPLISYFQEAKKQFKISSKDINTATKTQMCSHWFSSSQWKLPTKEQYEILQTLFTKQSHLLNKPI